ncbi:MAG: peptidoglycan-binding protein [Candidatus Pacebacteria bacterium]|nr:peptidoglycan-binding protein [Candidatus Paceibacterota bacterium]
MSNALATPKVAAVLAGLAMVVGFAFAFATPAKADVVSDLQAQIQALLAQIATISGGTTTGGSCTPGQTFTRNHKAGETGGEIMWIQQFLNANGFTVAASGAGSKGNETSYFGPATKAAVIKFQNAHAADVLTPVGLTTGTGFWGAASRAKANMMGSSCTGTGTGTGTGTTPTGTGLTVSAAAQPANSLAPQGVSRVPFTTFTLTNNSGVAVTVNGIVVERTGLAQDSVFSGLVLVDNGSNTQIGTSKTLNSNHQAVVGEPFTMNPGETKSLTIAGNMASSLTAFAGQVVAVSVVGVNTTATVAGSLPITGAQHTINASLSVGSVSTSTSSFDPGAASSKNIGDTAVRFTGLRFTAGSAEDIRFYSIRWRQVGTASAVDLSNLVTVVDGVQYPVTADSSGKYYTTSFPGGLLIQKGNSVDVYVQGDLTGSNSASRTVRFDLDRATDVYFIGQTYGYGVSPGYPNSQPWFTGYTATINPGTVTTIGKANTVAAQNIAVNVQNQPLGGFETNFAGEAVSVQGMTFTVSTSSANIGGLLTNVSVVDQNGVVVAGPVDATNPTNGASQTLTFTDTVTFPVGKMVYTLKGRVSSSATSGAVIIVATTPSGWTNPTGQTSGNSITIGTSAFNMNAMTVKGVTLAVSASTQPSSQSIVAGVQGFTFANVQLDASQSGEDVRVTSIPVYYANLSGTPASSFSGCQLWDGVTPLNTGGRVVNSVTNNTSSTFSLDNSLTIPKGTVKTLAVKCNLGTSASGSAVFGIAGGASISGTGSISGNSLSATVASSTSGVMTIGTGTYAVSVDSSSPSFMVVAAGSTGVNAGVVKLRASNEDVSLTKLGLHLTSGDEGDVLSVDIYDGATKVGTAYFTSGTYATSTLTTAVTLPKDNDKTLTLKANLAGIGSSESGLPGVTVKVDPSYAEGSGLASGSTLYDIAEIGVAGFGMYKSFPTLALESGSQALGSTGIADGRLIRFKVTADAKGPVGIAGLGFSISTTTVNVTNVALYGYTNSTYSSAISGQGTSGQIGSTIATWTFGAENKIVPTTNAVQVPAGQTYYFELRGSVSGATTGSSVVTTLNGDSTAQAITQAVTATTTHSFAWSGNSTSTSNLTGDADWTNGYSIEGLPSSGLIQTRSN